MIKSFGDKKTEMFANGIKNNKTKSIPLDLHNKIFRLLDRIDNIENVESLRIPPSNYLEKKIGNLKEYWSIRINQQYRIIFQWIDGNAYDVKIIDYH